MARPLVIIFGASGDLTARKLVPSLYRLRQKGRLPEGTRVLGVSRRPLDDERFRQGLEKAAREYLGGRFDLSSWQGFAPSLHYLPGDMTRSEFYPRLEEAASGLGASDSPRVYYLATAPSLFSAAVERLGEAGLVARQGAARRVVLEKPFGRDGASARALNEQVHRVLDESQVYRIDHYLGKETVQNLMVLRFSNAIFEPLWNRRYVDHVQITVAETVGVEHRAGYYDRSGVLRDMVQNHLLQLLSLVALEPPSRLEADLLRNEKVKVLEAVRRLAGAEAARGTVRGQYRGYLEKEGVAAGSATATFAALRLFVDNWRWQGVPFYLRTGKRLARKVSEIDIHFRCPPLGLLGLGDSCRLSSNVLSICLQPDEGIHLRIDGKVPGEGMTVRPHDLEFHYAEAYGDTPLPDAYERLLLDVLQGDASLFTRADEVEAAWAIVDPLLAAWEEAEGPPLATYESGGWGPAEAEALLGVDGRRWELGCVHE
jgi:glucose-6-phosphate 1-dehydrogenase